MIVASTIGSFAAVNFSDVASNHWAKDFIVKMADKKIISGYFDNKTLKLTFKPDNPVSYVEATQMIYSTLKSTNKLKSTAGLVTKHSTSMTNAKIPQWAHEAVAYALEYNILHPEDLKSFMNKDNQVSAKRADVAIFLGKALDMKDALDPLPILNFVDAELIKSQAVPYVDLLVKKGIVNGDTQNKFNPNTVITRAQMATMCAKAYDLLIGTQINPPTTPKTETKQERFIQYVNKSANMIVVEDEKDNRDVHTIRNIPIIEDRESRTILDLQEGDKVELTFDTSGNLKEIEILERAEKKDIENKRIIDYIDSKAKMMVVKDEDDNTQVYNLEDVYIKEDGKSKRISDLDEGDSVVLVFDTKGILVGIEIDDTIVEFEGRIESIKDYDDYYLLVVRDQKNLVLKKEFKIYDSTEIKYDTENKSLSVSKLKEGDYISIKFSGDRAIKIVIDTEETEYNGLLESYIDFNKGYPILKLRANNNEVLEFEIDDDVYVRRDRSRAEIYDLAKGDIVSVVVQNNKVTDIYATSRSVRGSEEGRIKQIIIGNPSKIVIEDEDDMEYTYSIANTVDVEIDDDDADIRDLDINYEVELRIENDLVTEIEAKKVAAKNTITGDIVKLYAKYDRMTVKHFSEAEEKYINRSIAVTDDTKIISKEGDTIRIGHLDEDTTVIITGYYDDDIFVADRIIELD